MHDPSRFDPLSVIPSRDRVTAATSAMHPYEQAWELAHSGRPLSEIIEAISLHLDVSYDLASALAWAEITSAAVRFPA